MLIDEYRLAGMISSLIHIMLNSSYYAFKLNNMISLLFVWNTTGFSNTTLLNLKLINKIN